MEAAQCTVYAFGDESFPKTSRFYDILPVPRVWTLLIFILTDCGHFVILLLPVEKNKKNNIGWFMMWLVV